MYACDCVFLTPSFSPLAFVCDGSAQHVTGEDGDEVAALFQGPQGLTQQEKMGQPQKGELPRRRGAINQVPPRPCLACPLPLIFSPLGLLLLPPSMLAEHSPPHNPPHTRRGTLNGQPIRDSITVIECDTTGRFFLRCDLTDAMLLAECRGHAKSAVEVEGLDGGGAPRGLQLRDVLRLRSFGPHCIVARRGGIAMNLVGAAG